MASLTTNNDYKTNVDDESEPIPTSLDISKLLLEHDEEIQKLMKLAPPPAKVDPYCKYDNIFYLRYILSFRTAEKAKEAVDYCFEFRSEPRFLELAKILHEDKFLEMPVVIEAKKWQVGAPLENVLTSATGGGVAILIRAGMCNTSMMHDRITKKDIREMNLAHREGSFQLCDKLTRESGMLCKQTMFMDMTGSALSSMMDRRQNDTHAEMSKIGSLVYPQLTDKFCILNAPSWMGWLMSIFKKIASKRSMEKVELFTSSESLWSSEWAKKRLIRKNFPHFVGGDIPEEKLTDELSGKYLAKVQPPQVTISARSKEVISFEVPAFKSKEEKENKRITFDYVVSVQARGVEMKATFVPSDESKKIIVRKGGKIKAENGPITGVWTILNNGKPGILQIEFDNTYSMLRSKTVIYEFNMNVIDITKEDSGCSDGRSNDVESKVL